MGEAWRSWHASDAREIEVAHRIEHDIFAAEGFSEISDTGHAQEFEKYNAQSRWFLASRGDAAPSGVMRVIVAGEHSVPACSAFDDEPSVVAAIEQTRAAEVGVAVAAEARGSDAALHLYAAGYRDARAIGTEYWIAVIEEWYFNVLRDLHFPFEALAKPRWYMGGDCLPALMNLHDAVDALEKHDPALLAFMRGDDTTW